MIEKGDEGIYPNPGFPIYESMINFAGGTAVPLQLNEESGFNAEIDDLHQKVTSRTKMIILNSPNNPCGSVIPRSDLEKIASIASEAGIVVLADEIYKDFYYEGSHHSVSGFHGMQDNTIILDGFSKSYAMTGWRLGYGVLPAPLVEPISRLVTNSVSCTSSFSQQAAITALDASQDSVTEMVNEFKRRRDVVVDGLNSIDGIICQVPKGAFYAFPNIRGTGLTSRELADRLLSEAGVALLSGTAFGQFGDGYLRLSFANSLENINEGIQRIATFIDTRQ